MNERKACIREQMKKCKRERFPLAFLHLFPYACFTCIHLASLLFPVGTPRFPGGISRRPLCIGRGSLVRFPEYAFSVFTWFLRNDERDTRKEDLGIWERKIDWKISDG